MNKTLYIMLTLLVGLLAACSVAGGPEQIASYPRDEPIAQYPHTVENIVIYNATLDLEVSDVDRAAEHAKEIAFQQGGYLVSAQSWYRDGQKHSTLVLSVPAYRFDSVKDDLLRLGDLVGEWISSELVSTGSGRQDIDAQITVYLHPRDSASPKILFSQWRPVRTFENALKVFVSIFGFLLDIVIWVAVVAGPFVLIGLGIMKILQWGRKTQKQSNQEPD